MAICLEGAAVAVSLYQVVKANQWQAPANPPHVAVCFFARLRSVAEEFGVLYFSSKTESQTTRPCNKVPTGRDPRTTIIGGINERALHLEATMSWNVAIDAAGAVAGTVYSIHI